MEGVDPIVDIFNYANILGYRIGLVFVSSI